MLYRLSYTLLGPVDAPNMIRPPSTQGLPEGRSPEILMI